MNGKSDLIYEVKTIKTIKTVKTVNDVKDDVTVKKKVKKRVRRIEWKI
jgi:hypothetical protein